jgi:hypothetical protein
VANAVHVSQKILSAQTARAVKAQADILGNQTDEQLKTRLRNWYITRTSAQIASEDAKVYLICGDKFEYFLQITKNKMALNLPVYQYYQLGFLRIVKTVSSGFQCEVVDSEGKVSVVSCRWDMRDKYFQQQDLAKLSDTYNVKDIVHVLKDQMLIETHEAKIQPE